MDVVALLSMLFGGLSALTGVAGLFSQLRKVNRFRLLRNQLTQKPTRHFGKVEEEFVELLQFGALIATQIVARLSIRFFISMLAILLAIYFIPLDTEGAISDQVQSLEFIDIPFIPLLLAGFVNNTAALIQPAEREFLNNCEVLYEIFYREYVMRALGEFNIRADRIKKSESFRHRTNEIIDEK